jgi:hypothetical protein
MAATSTSTAVATVEPAFTEPERRALAGFLAGYTGLTREAYALDLRQYASWCQQHHLRLFQVRRTDIECFARDLEARGRARATITRRLCTIAGFYKYAVEEELLEHRNVVGFLARAQPGQARPHGMEGIEGHHGTIQVQRFQQLSEVAGLVVLDADLEVVQQMAAAFGGAEQVDANAVGAAGRGRSCRPGPVP